MGKHSIKYKPDLHLSFSENIIKKGFVLSNWLIIHSTVVGRCSMHPPLAPTMFLVLLWDTADLVVINFLFFILCIKVSWRVF